MFAMLPCLQLADLGLIDFRELKQVLKRLYLPLIIVAIIGLWQYPILYPLKLLVVFFHESSHALMTIVTGGSVKEMVVNSNQGGHVISVGGSRLLSLNAGYLGSLFWGAVIYLLALKSRWDRVISSVLGLIIILITLFFVRNLFGLVFGVASGAAMMLLGRYGNEAVNDLWLRVVGVTSMIYVPLDIYSDTISRSALRSDARMLAEEMGGATVIWGGVWIAISLVVLYKVVKVKSFSSSEPAGQSMTVEQYTSQRSAK